MTKCEHCKVVMEEARQEVSEMISALEIIGASGDEELKAAARHDLDHLWEVFNEVANKQAR